MLNTEQRIALLVQLGQYMLSDSEEWDITIDRAVSMNAWFTRGNIELAVGNICAEFLEKDKFQALKGRNMIGRNTLARKGEIR